MKKSARFTTPRFARWCISTGEAELRSSSFSSSSSFPAFVPDYENEDDDEDD
jgi:hypothetical protein